MLVVANV